MNHTVEQRQFGQEERSRTALCSDCETFEGELELVLESDEAIPDAPVWRIGRVEPYPVQAACRLCQMFLDISPRENRSLVQELRISEIQANNDGVRRRWGAPHAPGGLFLANVGAFPNRTTGRRGFIEVMDRQRASNTGVSVRNVSSPTADLDLVKSWLRECKKHRACAKKMRLSSRPWRFKLIDCVRWRVVSRQVKKFAALSYAWGTSYRQRRIKSRRRNPLEFAPLVVRDAAKVTLSLSMRYLWVDQYCIDQDNAREKRRNIRNMDRVFESAELVICAADGQGADDGLSGISSSIRKRQPRCILEKFELRSTLPNVKWAVAHSLWNTRGWTLQEARLGRRCLFFTQYQMYFVCRTSTRSESINHKSIRNGLESFMNDFTLDSSLFSDIRDIKNRGHAMFLDRQMFSHRELTNPHDALNAMRGILNRSPFFTFWGVPIQPYASAIDPSLGIAFGLLWSRDLSPNHSGYGQGYNTDPERSRRLRYFPTWSWASITGTITSPPAVRSSPLGMFQYNLEGLVDDDIASSLNVQIPDPKDAETLISLHEALKTANSANFGSLPETSKALFIEGDLLHLEIHCKIDRINAYAQWQHPTEQPQRASGMQLKLRLDLEKDEYSDKGQHTAYALILIEDHRNEKQEETVDIDGLLLESIDDDVFERRGLLHRHAIPLPLFDALVKERTTFWLE